MPIREGMYRNGRRRVPNDPNSLAQILVNSTRVVYPDSGSYNSGKLNDADYEKAWGDDLRDISGNESWAKEKFAQARYIRNNIMRGGESKLTSYQRRKMKADASAAFGGKALTVG